MRLARAVGLLAGLAVAGPHVGWSQTASPDAPALSAGEAIAQAQPSTESKPKKKPSKTRKPTPCGPGTPDPLCGAGGKSGGLSGDSAGIAVPV